MSSNESQDLPRIPELEEDYEFIRELGRGGTAVVYLARERDVERYVAIKLMHPGYLQDDDAVARLMREARTVARLQHPNIVMLLGVRRLGDRGYGLVLQYVPGTTVKERIREEGPLPVPLTERILTDLGSALQYAHRHRIVHRDIKPENVFLDADSGVSRLADFGIARFWDTDSGLTLPGTAIGTPTYMSPEQVDGRDLDGRSDLYSVGLVAYEMLTGQPPWAGETLYKIVYKQKHEELPPLGELRPEVPHHIRSAIEKALRKNPNDRWRDAGEFLAALQNPHAHRARPAARAAPPLGPSPLKPPPDPALADAKTVLFNRAEVEAAMRGGAQPGHPASEPPEGGSQTTPGGEPGDPRVPFGPLIPTPPADAADGTGYAPSWLLAVERGAVGRSESAVGSPGSAVEPSGSSVGRAGRAGGREARGTEPGSIGGWPPTTDRASGPASLRNLIRVLWHRWRRPALAVLLVLLGAAVLLLYRGVGGPSAPEGGGPAAASPFSAGFPVGPPGDGAPSGPMLPRPGPGDGAG
jgi:hypothetical protein